MILCPWSAVIEVLFPLNSPSQFSIEFVHHIVQRNIYAIRKLGALINPKFWEFGERFVLPNYNVFRFDFCWFLTPSNCLGNLFLLGVLDVHLCYVFELDSLRLYVLICLRIALSMSLDCVDYTLWIYILVCKYNICRAYTIRWWQSSQYLSCDPQN